MFHNIMLNQIFVNENFLYIVVSSLVQEETVDKFHCGSVVRFDRPTTHHKVP